MTRAASLGRERMCRSIERYTSWKGNVDEMRCPVPENMSVAIHTGRRQVDLEASMAAIARLTPRSQPRTLSRCRDCGERLGNGRLLGKNLSGGARSTASGRSLVSRRVALAVKPLRLMAVVRRSLR